MQKLNADANLIAVVRYFPGKGKCYNATEIEIRCGSTLVASAIRGGRWNQADALREYRKNPASFKAGPGAQLLKVA